MSLPEGMKRSMSRQAEAERERRARIITADGEYQASKRLAAAANVMARDPAALQLRLLQTVVEVAGERNSTLVMPVPVELLRFFDRMTPGAQQPAEARPEEPEDLGDAEVAEAEAEISKANLPELEESSVPPVPEVAAASESVQELPAAAAEPDLIPQPEPEGLPSSEVPRPTATASAAPDSAAPDSEDTTSFPVVDPASTNGEANGATEAARVPPARKPRASTARKPRTPAGERKPRTTNGDRTPRPQA
ncbi:MAG TPA: hypothetical protein VGJ19_04140 [Streptosporangiaceae bacterium]